MIRYSPSNIYHMYILLNFWTTIIIYHMHDVQPLHQHLLLKVLMSICIYKWHMPLHCCDCCNRCGCCDCCGRVRRLRGPSKRLIGDGHESGLGPRRPGTRMKKDQTGRPAGHKHKLTEELSGYSYHSHIYITILNIEHTHLQLACACLLWGSLGAERVD